MMPNNFPKNKIIITDASCFIILQKINAIYLLNDLFAAVITTPEIANEFGQPLPTWVELIAVNDYTLYEKFKLQIDSGEASVIALACEIQYDYLILDDLQARKFAEKQGFKVKGTLGILLLAKLRGIIPLLFPYLERLQQTNFRISQNLIRQILQNAGE